MSQILGLPWVRHINDRSPVRLHDARERIHGTAGVVADIGNFTIPFFNDDRLVGRTALKVAPPCQFHVPLRLLIGRMGSRLGSGRSSGQRNGRDSWPVWRKTL